MVDEHLLQKFVTIFANLHRNKHHERGAAPHKPVFLLALLDEIACRNIRQNHILLTPELISRFHAYWASLVVEPTWQPRMAYPFRYLIQDGIWELLRDDAPLTAKEIGDPTSLRQLTLLIDAAAFPQELWQLIMNQEARTTLRQTLFSTYFPQAAHIPVQECYEPLNYAAERLRLEAIGRFRATEVREPMQNDLTYLRHMLFPRVIKELYEEHCAVCCLQQSALDKGSVVDAAHIMPFHLFHNDDPRNGLSLCKNHHWGFDNGLFTVDENYRLILSTRIQVSKDFLTTRRVLHLPSIQIYQPALEALQWHRKHVFEKGYLEVGSEIY